ncbi:glycosyltransferase family 2 protein [Flavobacterium sp. XN-5]|uniref:glycosyltransferase family 2 protein n=1 Tax=Flavobacterium sp. XN-5 TaxID=2599390 RepID=UPI0011CB9C4B|nr:glycosyltransferase family A protein [Flavobacterium sp. XN-5]NGY37449.1 glycosyltransferase family 2 protein [Flavobacterium sp. XN-5]
MKLKSNVTVIIPCYNDGQYIIKAVDSILNQTIQADEIIIVDDGSGQETKNVLKTIYHPNVHIIHQENIGVSNTRNTAIAIAQTEYILNLDADDYFDPVFIEKAIQVLNENERVGVVGCLVKILKNNIFEKEIKKPLGGGARNFLVKNNGISGSMFRKKCWEEVSGYDEKMANGYEDWEFWISILSHNWMMHIIQEPLFIYRQKAISRDQTALVKFDFELRKYIFLKHKALYEAHFEFYAIELLRQNTLLKNNVRKAKNSADYTIGQLLLAPLRFLKKKNI